MRRNFVLPGFALVLIIISCTGQKANELSANEFKKKMSENVTVLDVRTPSEFSSGHLAGALNIDIKNSQFEKECEQLDKSKPVLVYCLAGSRSSRAGELLRKKGFKVLELKGGINAWQEEGFPVVK